MSKTITIAGNDAIDEAIKANSLQTLAQNVSAEALQFLAEMSTRPNVSQKLLSKKTMIKTFL